MLASTPTKHLAAYFSCSTEFFYIVTDSKGTCRNANSFFDTVFRKDGIEKHFHTFFSRPDTYFQLIQECAEGKEVTVTRTLEMKMPDGSVKEVRWEFAACQWDELTCIQAIGSMVNGMLNERENTDRLPWPMLERYRAYEQSPEGLWRFDAESPVAADLEPDAIITYWRKYSSLTECNDSLARMYGFDKAEDLIGVTLDQFIDFSDDGRMENLRVFIRNGLRSMQVETKEFDRFGNIKYFLNQMEGTVKNGMILRVWGTQLDITEQRRLSQQLIEQAIQRQKLITQATIDAQEKERLEIGKELHDNINQHLTTTRLYLEVASEKASGDVLEMISLAHKTLKDIVNEIRRLSQSLVPPTLGDLGLAESIQDLCDSLRRTHSYKIGFHHRHFNEEELPANLKLMIFRIIQEQVNNIIRHAQAKTIRIKLQADAENIIFSIADDGQGFDPEHYKRGMGISNISNRASLFSGKVEIDTAPGKGCTITIIIPLAVPESTLI